MSKREDWMPYGIMEKRVAINRIASQMDEYGPILGLTPVQIDRVKAIAVEYDFAVTIYERNRTTNKALRSWRDSVISGKRLNKAAGDRPVYDNTLAPAGTRIGLVGEIRRFVEMIKTLPGYNIVVGTALGILPPNHVKKSLKELKPMPKVTAVNGYRLKIACEKEGMDALQVEYRRDGEERWEKVAFLTVLPATIYIEPRVMGVPEGGRIRVIYIKKNVTVGEYSNMIPVTLSAS